MWLPLNSMPPLMHLSPGRSQALHQGSHAECRLGLGLAQLPAAGLWTAWLPHLLLDSCAFSMQVGDDASQPHAGSSVQACGFKAHGRELICELVPSAGQAYARSMGGSSGGVPVHSVLYCSGI